MHKALISSDVIRCCVGAWLGFALQGTLRTRVIAGRRGAERRRTKDRRGLASSGGCRHFEEAPAAGGGRCCRRSVGCWCAGLFGGRCLGGGAALDRAPALAVVSAGQPQRDRVAQWVCIYISTLCLSPGRPQVCHARPAVGAHLSYPAVGAHLSCPIRQSGPFCRAESGALLSRPIRQSGTTCRAVGAHLSYPIRQLGSTCPAVGAHLS